MHYRTLGRTRLKVSIIGFGAWGIGKGLWVGAEDDASLRALHAALDAGVNFFDTARDQYFAGDRKQQVWPPSASGRRYRHKTVAQRRLALHCL